VSVLAGTTAEWFQEFTGGGQLVRGGFLPRFLIVPADQEEKRIPFLPSEFTALVKGCTAEALEMIPDSKVRSSMSEQATEEYTSWYQGSKPAERVKEVWGRIRTTIPKIALLIQFSMDGQIHVRKNAMEWSIALAQWHLGNVEDVYAQLSPLASRVQGIAAHISAAGGAGVPRSKLTTFIINRWDVKGYELDYLVRTAIASGKITATTTPSRKGPPLTRYFATEFTPKGE